jgi:hypothetical protein
MMAVRRTGSLPDGSALATHVNTTCPPTFLFVLNPLDFESGLPFDFAPQCTIRRAADWELVSIRETLGWLRFPNHSPPTSYEANCMEVKTPTGATYSFEPLPKEKWRYTVVSVDGGYDDKVRLLEWCGSLLSPALEIGFTGTPIQFDNRNWVYGCCHNPTKLFAFWESRARFGESAKLMPNAELVALGNYWAAVQQLAPDSFVRKALESFDQTRLLPDFSAAVALALFGIVESLVTHIPEPKDTLDSLRRQLRTKMKLLRKRFVRPIDLNVYFDTCIIADEEKLWNKLYDYRSRLAHGGSTDFAKDFRALTNCGQVVLFLRETVRLLLVIGLHEEVFLSDLRDC